MLTPRVNAGRASLPMLALGFGIAVVAAGIVAAMRPRPRADARGEISDAGESRNAEGTRGSLTLPATPSDGGAGTVRPGPATSGPDQGEDPDAGDKGKRGLSPEKLERIVRGQLSLKGKVTALKLAARDRSDPEFRVFRYLLEEGGVDAALRAQAVILLVRIAPVDAKARAVLADYALKGRSDDLSSVQAMGAVLRSGADEEIRRCSNAVFQETSVEAVALEARALAANKSPAAQSLLFDLARAHPDPEARHRAEEERTGKFCADHSPSTGADAEEPE